MKLSQKFLKEFEVLVTHWLRRQSPKMQDWLEAEIERLLDGNEHQKDWPAREEFFIISRFKFKKESFDPESLLIMDILDSACFGVTAVERFEQFESSAIKFLSLFLDAELVTLFLEKFEEYAGGWGGGSEERKRHCFRDSVRSLERRFHHHKKSGNPDSSEELRDLVTRSVSKIVRPNRERHVEVRPSLVSDTVVDTLIGQEQSKAWAEILFRCGQCALFGLGKLGKIQDAGLMAKGFMRFFVQENLMVQAMQISPLRQWFLYSESQRFPTLKVASQAIYSGQTDEGDKNRTAFFLLIDPERRLIWFDFLHSRFLHLCRRHNYKLNHTRLPHYFRTAYKKADSLMINFPEEYPESPPVSLPDSLFQETLGRIRPKLMERLDLLIGWKTSYDQ
ncbi:MAG: hypothetical protein H3C47_06280 [Candidatus Cloacimonetes bacterium]|nr:hypothetical protein [Candidatus Cloacimonadota bacterium]